MEAVVNPTASLSFQDVLSVEDTELKPISYPRHPGSIGCWRSWKRNG
jgi:hypothetical protein